MNGNLAQNGITESYSNRRWPNSPPFSKGAYVLVQDELHSRDYESRSKAKKITIKQRIWEIHITSILKLDRTERVDEAASEWEPIEDPEVAH